MKIIEINAVPYGSTGMIAREISNLCIDNGYQSYFCYSWTKKKKSNVGKNEILIGSFFGKLVHMFLSRLTGKELNFSYIDTLLFLKKIDKIKPDIIHLHIMHSWYINIPLLFKYIKKHNIKVVWTFHDCWAFTGHCPYFDIVKCNKWIDGCCNCSIFNKYPESFIDNSKYMYNFKKKWFTYLDSDSLVIVSPSIWLSNLIKQSYMNKYKCKVINNGIELNIFRPVESDFPIKYSINNKIIILCVALDWGERKGLDIVIKLANDLPSEFQIVMVGTTKEVDSTLPNNIISIHKTHNREELVGIYSCSDCFINPTREDNFPTVNIESLACGTPVITFDTGGSPEIIDDNCGYIVEKDNYYNFLACVKKIKKKDSNIIKKCINRASLFNKNNKFGEYLELFCDFFQEGDFYEE